MADLPWLPRRRCAVCAIPLASGAVCGACLDRPPRFDRVEAPFAYRFPVDASDPRPEVRRPARAGAHPGRSAGAGRPARCGRDRSDAAGARPARGARIQPGTRDRARRRRAHRHPVCFLGACRKVVDTPPQAALPWKERAKNVRRAFVCDADLEGRADRRGGRRADDRRDAERTGARVAQGGCGGRRGLGSRADATELSAGLKSQVQGFNQKTSSREIGASRQFARSPVADAERTRLRLQT